VAASLNAEEKVELAREIDVHPGLASDNAKYLSVETHELYKNRGKNRPGNQLDLRRGIPDQEDPSTYGNGVTLFEGSWTAPASNEAWNHQRTESVTSQIREAGTRV
jgi:hypothetical protein